MGFSSELGARIGPLIHDYFYIATANATVLAAGPAPTGGGGARGETLLPLVDPSSRSWSRGLVAVLLVVLVAGTIIRRRCFSAISHVPGPFLGSISRLWQIRQTCRGNQQIVVAALHEKHGRYVRIAHDEVSVCHPDAVREILVRSLHKSDWYKIFRLPDWRTPTTIAIQDPREKLQVNKCFAIGFVEHNLLRSESHMDEVIAQLQGRLDRASADSTPIRIGELISYTSFDLTGTVTFSRSFGFTERGEDINSGIASTRGLELVFVILGHFRWFSYVFCNPVLTWLGARRLGYLCTVAQSELAERQKNPEARPDIAATWFRSLDKISGDGKCHWDHTRILNAAFGNLIGGSDTISCAIQSFVYHLLRHPTGWQTIRDEIDAARRSGRCDTPVVSYKDAQRLPYLQATLKEALRIFSPVTHCLPRVAPKGGVKFDDGAFFPEGTILSINPYVMHTSKELWGPDALEFKPERWLGPDVAVHDKYFCPWGGGWSSCPGRRLARIEMSKLAATMVRDYDFRQVNPKEEWTWTACLTTMPKGWPVYVTKRHTVET